MNSPVQHRRTAWIFGGFIVGIVLLGFVFLFRDDQIHEHGLPPGFVTEQPHSSGGDTTKLDTSVPAMVAPLPTMRTAPEMAMLNLDEEFAESDHHHIKRSWQGRLAPSLADLGRAWQEGGLSDGFLMPLFDGRDAHIIVHSYNDAGFGRGVFIGSVQGFPGSLVSLAHVGEAESGTIQIPQLDEVFEVRPGPEGSIILSEIDVHELGGCATCAAGLPH